MSLVATLSVAMIGNPITHKPVSHTAKHRHHHRRHRRSRRITQRPQPQVEEGWAIPWAIVNCESKGVNEPPNSAGASGYYQIIPLTWSGHGGGEFAGEAWRATKRQQGIVARRIWDENGPSQWDCTRIVGY